MLNLQLARVRRSPRLYRDRFFQRRPFLKKPDSTKLLRAQGSNPGEWSPSLRLRALQTSSVVVTRANGTACKATRSNWRSYLFALFRRVGRGNGFQRVIELPLLCESEEFGAERIASTKGHRTALNRPVLRC